MSTLRHVRTHTSGLGSLHVTRIIDSDFALGFLWLETESKGKVFDEILVPKLARAFAAKLAPFLRQCVTTDRARVTTDSEHTKAK